jgi:sortase A
MTDVQLDAPALPGGRHRRPGRTRLVLRTIGFGCILAALAIAGYLLWQQFGTALTTKRWQSDLRPALEERVRQRPVAVPPDPVKVPGDAVAIIRIPGIDLDMVVVEGADTESLRKGPGHYEDSPYPWDDRGTVAIAGHRTTYGAPFYSLDELTPGDSIELATEYGTFDYEVRRLAVTPPSGVMPSGRSVLEQTQQPTLVLTTCNPRFSAAQRLVVFADRVD